VSEPDPPEAGGGFPLETAGRARGFVRPAPLLLLSLGVLAWQFAFGLYRSVYNNFLVEVHGVRADQLGVIESVREVPGLLTVVLVAAVAGVAPPAVAAGCCLLMALGLILYPSAGGLGDLIVITLIFSTGFHLLFPPQNALVLHHAAAGKKGTWLGRIEGVGAGASLLAMAAAALLVRALDFRGIFLLAGVAAGVAAAVFFLTPGPARLAAGTGRPGLWREYASYYVLTLLQGSRRHFFLVFALYNLVEVHGVSTATVAALLAVSGAATVATRPLLGRLADTLGEMTVLAWCFGLVALVFTGYAFVHDLRLLYVLFGLDSVLTFELVIVLHAYRVADGSGVASALAGGSTVGHITGVLTPVGGGLLWRSAGPEATFLAGAAVCLAGLGYAVYCRARSATPKSERTSEPSGGAP